MKYEDMSKFYINSKVAMRLGHSASLEHECAKAGACFILTDTAGVRVAFNPCNNPSDAWPIIVDNGISIEFLDGGYVDVKLETEFGTFCPDDIYPKEKTFEAAMICFLKMKDAQQ